MLEKKMTGQENHGNIRARNPLPEHDKTSGLRTVEAHSGDLETLFDGLVDSVIMIDSRGIIHTVNRATVSTFGYTHDELVGNNVSMLMPSPYNHEHDEYIRHYLDSGVAKVIGVGREVSARRRDGTVFPAHLAVTEAVIDGVRYFTGFIRDISDVFAARKELQIAQGRLVQRERLAAIGQMVTGLAHESRNAFQRCHACLAELSLDLSGMPESLRLVQKVQKALDDLNRLLEEVRSYAAPIIPEIRDVDIAALVRESWQQAGESHALMPEFRLIAPDDLPVSIRIDGDRIRQVLINIFENAIIACPLEGIVEVSLQWNASSPERIAISVEDNGPGVPENDRERIFEPFFTTRTKGTGLGLAICRRIVESHDGTIGFSRSESLGGACFRFELKCRPRATSS